MTWSFWNPLGPSGAPGVPGTPGQCPGKNAVFCQFFYGKQQEIPWTPAGRPLFVLPRVPGAIGRCPEEFLKFMCPFLSWAVSQLFPRMSVDRGMNSCWQITFERGEKTPTPKISALLRKRPVLLRANFVLTKDRKRPYYRHFCGKIHREGACSKAAGGP